MSSQCTTTSGWSCSKRCWTRVRRSRPWGLYTTNGVLRSPPQLASSASSAALASQCGTRKAERGTEGLLSRSRPALFRVPRSPFRILLFRQRQQVCKQPIGSRDTRRQLAEEREPGVDVGALADACHEQAAPERRGPPGAHPQQPRGRRVPRPGGGQSPPPRPPPPKRPGQLPPA